MAVLGGAHGKRRGSHPRMHARSVRASHASRQQAILLSVRIWHAPDYVLVAIVRGLNQCRVLRGAVGGGDVDAQRVTTKTEGWRLPATPYPFSSSTHGVHADHSSAACGARGVTPSMPLTSRSPFALIRFLITNVNITYVSSVRYSQCTPSLPVAVIFSPGIFHGFDGLLSLIRKSHTHTFTLTHTHTHIDTQTHTSTQKPRMHFRPSPLPS
jgi:hypothetical protein